ncbi:hypothetical protein HDU93_001742 [Gonapodya sp. JEL0774]|nr:hypothetical protein HDU93_001742 [Gonapodya sp. JEL0774]
MQQVSRVSPAQALGPEDPLKEARVEPTLIHTSHELVRRKLVEWLTDIKNEMKLHSHTLALAVFLIDFYLSYRVIPQEDLQLVGAVALLAASKYQEVPSKQLNVATVIGLCCAIYRRDTVLKMERRLLSVVDYNFSWISPASLLDIVTGENPLRQGMEGPISAPLVYDSNASSYVSRTWRAMPMETSNGADDTRLFASLRIHTQLVVLAHRVLENSLQHAQFIGIKSSTLTVGSLLAADRLLMLSQQQKRTLLNPTLTFQLISIINCTDSNVSNIAFHLADTSVVDGLVVVDVIPGAGGNVAPPNTFLGTHYHLTPQVSAPVNILEQTGGADEVFGQIAENESTVPKDLGGFEASVEKWTDILRKAVVADFLTVRSSILTSASRRITQVETSTSQRMSELEIENQSLTDALESAKRSNEALEILSERATEWGERKVAIIERQCEAKYSRAVEEAQRAARDAEERARAVEELASNVERRARDEIELVRAKVARSIPLI